MIQPQGRAGPVARVRLAGNRSLGLISRGRPCGRVAGVDENHGGVVAWAPRRARFLLRCASVSEMHMAARTASQNAEVAMTQASSAPADMSW